MYRLVMISIDLSETLVTFCSRQNPKHFFSKKNFFQQKKFFLGFFLGLNFVLNYIPIGESGGCRQCTPPPPNRIHFFHFHICFC